MRFGNGLEATAMPPLRHPEVTSLTLDLLRQGALSMLRERLGLVARD